MLFRSQVTLKHSGSKNHALRAEAECQASGKGQKNMSCHQQWCLQSSSPPTRLWKFKLHIKIISLPFNHQPCASDFCNKTIKKCLRVAMGKGNGSCCLMGTEFHFGKLRNILDQDGGDGCTTMSIYLTELYSSWLRW